MLLISLAFVGDPPVSYYSSSWSFSSRILRGSFYHILYKNEGSRDSPRLVPQTQRRYTTGDVLTLGYDQYHCVLSPENDTVTLMIRGPKRFNPKHSMDLAYQPNDARADKMRLERLVASVAGC